MPRVYGRRTLSYLHFITKSHHRLNARFYIVSDIGGGFLTFNIVGPLSLGPGKQHVERIFHSRTRGARTAVLYFFFLLVSKNTGVELEETNT